MSRPLVILICLLAAGGGWALGLWSSPPEGKLAEGASETHPQSTRPRTQPVLTRNIETVTRAMDGAGAKAAELAGEWAEKDPDQFLSWLLRTKPAPSEEILTAFFAEWVRQDPEAAFEMALNLPEQFEDPVKAKLLGRMMSAALNKDWKMGLAWVNRIQEAGAPALRMAVDFDWLENPVLEMGEAIVALDQGDFTRNLLRHFMRNFSNISPDQARAWARSLPPEHARNVMGPVLVHWAGTDLKGALNYLANEASSNIRQDLGVIVMRKFAEQDPRAALAWAEAHMPVPNGSRQILQTWADGNLQEVTEFVVGLEDPQQRSAYVEILADARRRRTSAKLIEWVKPLSAENRAIALNAVANQITTWDQKDRRLVFLDYVASLPEAEISTQLLDQMNRGLVGRDPVQSLTWVHALPGELGTYGTTNMVQGWLRQNRDYAIRSINGMAEGPAREAAQRIIAKTPAPDR